MTKRKKGKVAVASLLGMLAGIGMIASACIDMDTKDCSKKTARSKESFNENWKFARFGPSPIAGGDYIDEPGVVRKESNFFKTWASSTEASQKTEYAVDGDKDSRWCANGAKNNQWVKIDLGKKMDISKAKIAFEFADKSYAYKLEVSNDGQSWALANSGNAKDPQFDLNKAARFVRLTLTDANKSRWASVREIELFDKNGNLIKPEKKKEKKVVCKISPSEIKFDDSNWRKLNVPHDWGIEGPFRQDLPGNTGKLPWKGIGWYRKDFKVPACDANKKVFIDFDGAMSNSKVYINGNYAGGWAYGYTAFRIDATKFIKFGETNKIAVRLDTVNWDSRWYPGAGIYRNTWIVMTDKVHLDHWGVQVLTPKITKNCGEVKVVATVDNESDSAAKVQVKTEIYPIDKNDVKGGKVAESCSKTMKIAAQSGQATLTTNLKVVNPKLWDIIAPNRYVVTTKVFKNGKLVDVKDTKFGFRILEFTKRDGFKLNGRRVEINGVCQHHDLGPLGAAFNVRAAERQIEILKEMGVNAIRTSHNPAATEFYELCDKMGVLVQAETFDCWDRGKRKLDYGKDFNKWWKRDIEALVKRARNHPSVFMWCIGNEILGLWSRDKAKLGRQISDQVKKFDITRPTTIGSNYGEAYKKGFAQAVDVFGFNYNIWQYGKFNKYCKKPNEMYMGTETSSCISSRGEYFFPVTRNNKANFQMSSYDVSHPGWGCTPDTEFKELDKHRDCMGEFVWTGFDYIGEPTPYNNDATNLLNFTDPKQKAAMAAEMKKLGKLQVPSRSSYFGIVDLVGFKKDRFYIYQARWRPNLPMAHILPHWTWPERVGKVTPIHVYTSGDEAELFLNGKSLGRKKRGKYDYRLKWDDVKYVPGVVKVVAYKNGKKWATDTVKTSTPAVKINLTADQKVIKADGYDLSFVTCDVLNAENGVVPRSSNLVKFSVEGAGEIIATGNGDATNHTVFSSKKRKAFNGKVMVIIRSKKGVKGAIKLTAQSEGLKGATITLEAK
ncbi:beta-galactosidase GalB [Lentisphaerota bacterium WC36G]|nr:DUF4982 domain-containing protein [Lentisphaerae bacterium WC36]UDQ99464.1 DUF4982 domain-containing protein [Lentisphaerae bacterium WC36]